MAQTQPLTVAALNRAIELLEDSKWYLEQGEDGHGKAVQWSAAAQRVLTENSGMPEISDSKPVIRTFKISATRGDEQGEFTFAGAENQDWHRSDLVTQGWTNILITEMTKKS